MECYITRMAIKKINIFIRPHEEKFCFIDNKMETYGCLSKIRKKKWK